MTDRWRMPRPSSRPHEKSASAEDHHQEAHREEGGRQRHEAKRAEGVMTASTFRRPKGRPCPEQPVARSYPGSLDRGQDGYKY